MNLILEQSKRQILDAKYKEKNYKKKHGKNLKKKEKGISQREQK